MRRLLLFVSILHISYCSCPHGFVLVSNGQCRGWYGTLSISDDQATNKAIAKCKEIQAQPLTIHNSEEQAYYHAATSSMSNLFVMGLVCDSSSHRWKWADGSAVDFKPSSYDKALDADCKTNCMWNVQKSGNWASWCGYTDVDTFDVYCTTQLQQPIPSDDGCESFEDDNDDDICYQVGATAENWQDAQKICQSVGSDIASIHNSRENSFVRRMAVSKGALSGMFLGASISGKGKEFEWIDGTKWDYENFFPGFPIAGYGDCLAMDTQGTTGEWVNVDCSSKQAVACERKQHYTAPACSAGPWIEGDIIYSTGFPVSASTPCDYILSVDTGKKVQVEILLLEANSCCDRLIISDNYIGGTVIANLTGEVNDEEYFIKFHASVLAT